MQKLETSSYAAVYVPYYRLQCALLKWVFGRVSQAGSAENFSPTSAAAGPWSKAEAETWQEVHERVPAALLDSDGERVIELNAPAEAAGVPLNAGLSLAVARAPELLCVHRTVTWEERLQEAVLQLAFGHSPLLENTAPGVCTLDLRMRRDARHGPWLEGLLTQLQRLGFKAKAGLGATPEMALQAAKMADRFLEIIDNRTVLQALPIESLQPSPALTAILHNWGVRTVGAFVRLPREAIGRRLGLEGLSLWDRAAGHSPQALHYVRPSERFTESVEFEYRVETLEPLLFLLRRFLERLCFRVSAGYRLIAELCLTLCLEGRPPLVRTLQIPAPTCDGEALFRITSQYLETVQTDAPISGFELEAKPSDPGDHQFDLYQGGLKNPNRFFQTLARLAALTGNDRVGVPEPLNTYRPDSVRLRWPDARWTLAPPSCREEKLQVGPAFRRCRPGVQAAVRLADGRPARIQSSLATGRVQAACGPWKLSGHWWDQSTWMVEEWDVQLQAGGLYRLARVEEDQWQVAGIYD